MKKILKYILVVVISFACVFIYNLFQAPTVVGINKIESNGLYDAYVVTYSDGSKDTITIKNGEDANDITIEDLYYATKEAKGYGDEYTLLDFVNEYLSFNIEQKDEAKAYLGMLSTVEVYCEFQTKLNMQTHQTGSSLSIGSGVIYQPDKNVSEFYIITNYHVVYMKESLSSDCIADKTHCFLYGDKVEIEEHTVFFGGKKYTYGADAIECEYVGGSMEYDIAVLKVMDSSKISNSHAKPITVCYDDATAGEMVVAIGNPEGLGVSVTKGIVSVDNEYVTMLACDNRTEITFRAMRIDAAVNGGNSGGGLFNAKGELLGIVNSKIVEEGIEGMAFALPAVTSIRLADNVIANASNTNKSPQKVDLGLELAVQNSSAVYDTENMTIKIKEEVCVSKINEDSMCQGHLAVGDILLSVLIDGQLYEIDREFRLDDLSWMVRENTIIVFNVKRANINQTIPVAISLSDFKKVA